MSQQVVKRKNSQPGPAKARRPDLVEWTPAAAVDAARNMLKIERTLGKVSDSLFDTILANEIGPATALAVSMVGDYQTATEVVHRAFEQARSDFSSYDGSDSPHSWVLGYVAEEAVRRSNERFAQTDSSLCAGASQSDTPDPESALRCLRPEGRLAVILTDVLGLTDEAAARIARVDLRTVRNRAAFARSWIARHLSITGRHGLAADGAHG